jgi:peroxiredoxin
LQRDLKSFEKADLQVVGISYDSPSFFKKFADANQVTSLLRSDPDSKTIELYHIRNPEAKGKAMGVPHPAFGRA